MAMPPKLSPVPLPSLAPGEEPGARHKHLRRQTVHGAAWSGIEGFAGQIISFLTFIVLARLLSSRDFGLVAMANLYVLVAQFFIFQGLGQAIIQFEDLDDQHLDTVFWINLAVGVFFLIVTQLVAHVVARWFAMPLLAPILRWLSPIFILAALSDVQNNLLTRQLQFRSLALRTLSSYLAGAVVGVALALSGAGAWSLVGQQLAIWLVNLLVLWTASPWRPKFAFSAPRARRLVRFGVKLLWVDLTGLLNRRADQVFVGKFLGAAAVGLYAVGARVATLLSEVLIRSLARVSVSALSRLQGQAERFAAAFYQIVEMQSVFVLPATVGLALLAPDVVQIFFGLKWAGAIPIMQLLLLACPFEALSAIHQSALVARGRPGWCSAIVTVHAAANVLAFAVAIHWGSLAVAAAFSARAALLYPLELGVLQRATRISVGKTISLFVPQILAVAVMAAVICLLRWQWRTGPAGLRLAGLIAAGACSYGLALQALNRRISLELWSYCTLIRPGATPG
jgi:O-antigen/teichoic acid export membrane protein